MNKSYLVLVAFLPLSVPISANDLAFPGFTGVLRTPTAEVAPEAEYNYQFNNYSDLGTSDDKTYNHIFTVGVGSNVELGGRLTNWYENDRVERSSGYARDGSDGQLIGKRDLSGNFKFKLPSLSPVLPSLAVGMTDFAGLAVNFKSAYGVATKEIGKAQFSVGYIKSAASRANTKRTFVGSFANFKYDLTPNISVMSDYVSRDISAGFSYKVDIFNSASLSLLAMTHKEESKWDNRFGLTLSLPLDFKKTRLAESKKNFVLKSESRNVDTFIQSLKSLGFSNVKVGKSGGIDVIIFENHLFNHSYIDPLAVVFANSYRYLGKNSKLRAITMKQGIPLFAVEINLKHYAQFINGNGLAGIEKLKRSSRAWQVNPNELKDVKWLESSVVQNKRPLDIRIRPELNTAIGTEYGVFDYSLGLTTNVNIPVAKATNIVASATLPVTNSNNYDENKIFEEHRIGAKLNQVAIQRLIKPSADVSLLTGFGYSSIGSDGFVVGEAVALWQPGDGENQLGARVTHMKANDDKVEDETMALATYKRNWNDKNIISTITYGQHYNKDRGVSVIVSRYFGDTELSAYIKGIEKHDMSGGLQISLPLTPRQDRKLGNVVVRGTQHLGYAIETTIKDPLHPKQNRLRYDMLTAPGLDNSLGSDFYDRQRMTPSHFINNLQHLKASTITLVK